MKNKKIIITGLLAIPFLANLIWYILVVLPNYSIIQLFRNQFIGALSIVSSIVILPIVAFLVNRGKK